MFLVVEVAMETQMSTEIKKFIAGFYFQGKHLLGMFCVEKVEKDRVGAIFVKWNLKLIIILVWNVHSQRGSGQKLKTN